MALRSAHYSATFSRLRHNPVDTLFLYTCSGMSISSHVFSEIQYLQPVVHVLSLALLDTSHCDWSPCGVILGLTMLDAIAPKRRGRNSSHVVFLQCPLIGLGVPFRFFQLREFSANTR